MQDQSLYYRLLPRNLIRQQPRSNKRAGLAIHRQLKAIAFRRQDRVGCHIFIKNNKIALFQSGSAQIVNQLRLPSFIFGVVVPNFGFDDKALAAERQSAAARFGRLVFPTAPT